MIQRKHTLFLLAAFAATLLCLFLPIGLFEPAGMGANTMLYNLGVRDANGMLAFTNMPLFIFLAFAGIIALTTVFLYRNRKLQAKLCAWCCVLHAAWYVYLAFCVFNQYAESGRFLPKIGACLPLIACILCLMARRGVVADERLVKAADRIR